MIICSFSLMLQLGIEKLNSCFPGTECKIKRQPEMKTNAFLMVGFPTRSKIIERTADTSNVSFYPPPSPSSHYLISTCLGMSCRQYANSIQFNCSLSPNHEGAVNTFNHSFKFNNGLDEGEPAETKSWQKVDGKTVDGKCGSGIPKWQQWQGGLLHNSIY